MSCKELEVKMMKIVNDHPTEVMTLVNISDYPVIYREVNKVSSEFLSIVRSSKDLPWYGYLLVVRRKSWKSCTTSSCLQVHSIRVQ